MAFGVAGGGGVVATGTANGTMDVGAFPATVVGDLTVVTTAGSVEVGEEDVVVTAAAAAMKRPIPGPSPRAAAEVVASTALAVVTVGFAVVATGLVVAVVAPAFAVVVGAPGLSVVVVADLAAIC